MDGLFILVVIGAIAFAVFHAKRERAKAKAAWQEVARALRLDLTPGGLLSHPSMRGIVDGFRVTVDVVTRGGGKNSKTYTRYRVHYTSLGDGLRLTREVPVVSAIGKMFGGQDLEVGDAEFDDKVVVRTKSEHVAKAYLTPARRRAIERFLSSHKNAVITERHATMEVIGLESHAKTLERRLRQVAELAQELVPDRGETRAVEVAEERSDALAGVAGLIAGAAVSQLRVDDGRTPPSAAEEITPREDAQPTAPESLPAPEISAGSTPVAIGSLLSLGGADHEETADTRAAPPLEMPEVGPIAPQPAPDLADDDIDSGPVTARARDVCEALFSEDGGLSKARETFAEQYEGLFVHWTGELRSARHFYSDLVFGSEPGTRAEMVVARVASGILGEREIVAVVQLPDGLDAELSSRVGEEVTIEGDLASMDPFMRQVFVRNASVVT